MYQPKKLSRVQFGNPQLRQPAKLVPPEEITSSRIQQLIADIRYTMSIQKFGVGLAAPQVGVELALSVVLIRPTPARADRSHFESVIINPAYTGIGKRTAMWEGCLSFGAKNSPVFAQAQRYKKIKAVFYDKAGVKQTKTLEGLPAHVFQHETDHLNGILFPERVTDHTSWMNASEYRQRIVNKREQSDTIKRTTKGVDDGRF